MSSQILVFGASGISGLGAVQEALQYATPSTFSGIIGLTNRPIDMKSAQIPKDPRVAFYSSFDLTQGTDFIISKLKTIPNISETTQVAFLAYVPPSSNSQTDPIRAELKRANVSILETAVTAIEAVAPGSQAHHHPIRRQSIRR
jgi:hypothetical protein